MNRIEVQYKKIVRKYFDRIKSMRCLRSTADPKDYD